MASWIPLESNPTIITEYSQKLGLEPGVKFSDIYGTDDDLLSMIPDPCHAFILLFPITPKYIDFSKKEAETLESEYPDSIFFMEQQVGNACGTIGVIHALANNRDACKFRD